MMKIENSIPKSTHTLDKSDFVSDQMVKWCPGCGAHAILNSVANAFPAIGYKKENYTFVSGIGCSSRFPYYMNVYGFHGIHGRAAAIATGVKLANTDLSVWIATGDGDSLAIGGNHFIHHIRRNIDTNVILFNNQIYGLTKGQFSPTTPIGSITKTSPYGTIESSFNVGDLVLGAQGSFFARGLDVLPKLMTDLMVEAAGHDGTSIIEVLQNCIIFNDKAHQTVAGRENRDENTILLKAGERMVFGKDANKGLRFTNKGLEAVEIGKNGITIDDILTHDPTDDNLFLQMALVQMAPPTLPLAIGVIRKVKKPTYDDLMVAQIENVKKNSKIKCMDDLLNSGDVFEVN